MSKLTLPIICAYLPFEVKVKHASGIWDVEGILNCEGGNADIMIGNQGYFQTIGIADFGKDYSLFLRPLSSLTIPIHHNGETFVPIERLKNIMEAKSYINLDAENHQTIELNSIEKAEGGVYWIQWTEKRGEELYTMYFEYNSQFNRFSKIRMFPNRQPLSFGHQLEMFQKLFEWHIDIFGLLESGDALPIEEDGK